MNEIRWTKSGTERFPWYKARIGYIELWCRSTIIVHATKNRRGIRGWDGTVYFGNKWVAYTKTRKLLESAKKDAERLAIEYLVGSGFTTLKALKKTGLLDEVLSEVGIDI